MDEKMKISVLCNTIEQMSADAEDKGMESFGMTLWVKDAKIITKSLIEIGKSKHGEWLGFTSSRFYGIDEDGEPIYRDGVMYRCSECRYGTVVKSNYCPRCGARMDKWDGETV